jgi:hypothetical protein
MQAGLCLLYLSSAGGELVCCLDKSRMTWLGSSGSHLRQIVCDSGVEQGRVGDVGDGLFLALLLLWAEFG